MSACKQREAVSERGGRNSWPDWPHPGFHLSRLASGPPAYVWWRLRAPLTGWGEAMSSVAAEQTETMGDLTSVVSSLWLCMLLPCGLRASVSKELTDFPFVS